MLDPDFLRDFSARWHEAWNSHDPERVVALCTEDVELVDPSLAAPARGPAALRDFVRKLTRACPDYRFEETEPAYASPVREKAIVPFRFEGTMTGPLDPPGFAPTGRRIAFGGDDHWDFRDGLVCRCQVLYDLNGIGVQLGAVPPPGSRGERVGVALQRLAARRLRRSSAVR